MSQKTRIILKEYFEVGDTPTESQFVDLIDSLVNIIDDGVCEWKKVTISYGDFKPEAGKIKFITAFNIPAGEQVHRFIIHPTIAFIGFPIIDVNIELYEESDTEPYVNTDVNVFSTVDYKSGKVSPGHIIANNFLIDFDTGNNIRIKLEVSGSLAKINDLTQGSITIYYKSDKIE